VTAWLNAPPPDLTGRQVLVHFWAVSCHLCHENMPLVAQLRAAYDPQILQLIAIHQPRQESDLDMARVRLDAEALGISEPCGLDRQLIVATAFENQYVPAYYLFDCEGKLAGRAAGAHGFKLIAPVVHRVCGVSGRDTAGG
jgi:hypothetical protein